MVWCDWTFKSMLYMPSTKTFVAADELVPQLAHWRLAKPSPINSVN
jgi:hypothetical protein